MDSISVNQFREKLKHFVEKVVREHQPIKITRRNGEDFVVISAEDWSREKEGNFICFTKPKPNEAVGRISINS